MSSTRNHFASSGPLLLGIGCSRAASLAHRSLPAASHNCKHPRPEDADSLLFPNVAFTTIVVRLQSCLGTYFRIVDRRMGLSRRVSTEQIQSRHSRNLACRRKRCSNGTEWVLHVLRQGLQSQPIGSTFSKHGATRTHVILRTRQTRRRLS